MEPLTLSECSECSGCKQCKELWLQWRERIRWICRSRGHCGGCQVVVPVAAPSAFCHSCCPIGVGLGLWCRGSRASRRGCSFCGRLLIDQYFVATEETFDQHSTTVTYQSRDFCGALYRFSTSFCWMAFLRNRDRQCFLLGRFCRRAAELQNCKFWARTFDTGFCFDEPMAKSEFGQICWFSTPGNGSFEWL